MSTVYHGGRPSHPRVKPFCLEAKTLMTRQTKLFAFVAASCLALFALAFIAAPRSCEWGLSAYFWSGVAVVFALLAAPFVLQTERPVLTRVSLAIGFGALAFVVWVAGLYAANVRIICRLF